MKIKAEWVELASKFGSDICATIIDGIQDYIESKVMPKDVYAKSFIKVIKPIIDEELGRKPEKRFKKPTPEDVKDYFITKCDEENHWWDFDPQNFWDFYESKGWMIGKSPMKDWKRAIATWKRSRPMRITKEQWYEKYDTLPTENVADVELGEKEMIVDGKRKYLYKGKISVVNVPMNAPKRPNGDYVWSESTNSWYYPM